MTYFLTFTSQTTQTNAADAVGPYTKAQAELAFR